MFGFAWLTTISTSCFILGILRNWNQNPAGQPWVQNRRHFVPRQSVCWMLLTVLSSSERQFRLSHVPFCPGRYGYANRMSFTVISGPPKSPLQWKGTYSPWKKISLFRGEAVCCSKKGTLSLTGFSPFLNLFLHSFQQGFIKYSPLFYGNTDLPLWRSSTYTKTKFLNRCF